MFYLLDKLFINKSLKEDFLFKNSVTEIYKFCYHEISIKFQKMKTIQF